MSASKTIAKNTLFLYGQMLLGMLIGLYTSRVILNVLGIQDFGIYNVVGGVVSMFGILNNAMASSTSRFITFEIGKNERLERLKTVFNTSLILHLGIAIVVCVLCIPVGLWFMNTYMQLPQDRMQAINWVFYGALISTFLSIINVPFVAVLISYERMNIFAYFSLIDLILKLGIVILLQTVTYDKLQFYAFSLVVVQLIMQLLYWGYSYKNFKETRANLAYDKNLLKNMTSFAGWSLLGDSAVLLFTQGLNMLLNVFFGTTINAARGIAVQVQGLVSRFIGGFQTAINPQITKSYAANDLAYMHKLIFLSSKFSFILFLGLSLPILLETNFILTTWLKIIPEHTVNFVRIILMIALIDCLANPLVFAAKATGKIKKYQAVLGTLLLTVVPISYLTLKLGYPPEAVFVVHFIVTIVAQFTRVILIKPMIGLSYADYFNKLILRCLLVFLGTGVIPLCIYLIKDPSISRVVFVVFSTIVCLIICTFFVGMTSEEKIILKGKIPFLNKKNNEKN